MSLLSNCLSETRPPIVSLRPSSFRPRLSDLFPIIHARDDNRPIGCLPLVLAALRTSSSLICMKIRHTADREPILVPSAVLFHLSSPFSSRGAECLLSSRVESVIRAVARACSCIFPKFQSVRIGFRIVRPRRSTCLLFFFFLFNFFSFTLPWQKACKLHWTCNFPSPILS